MGKDSNPGLIKQSPVFPICDVSKLGAELLHVIGKKPMVEIWLDGIKMEALWDSGSMISLMNRKVFEEKFLKYHKIHSVEQFMGTGLKLSAANQTDLNIGGIVVLDFGIEKDVLFQVPFILTDDDVKDIIIGYNVIENVIVDYGGMVDPHQFFSKILNVSDGIIEGMVNEIRATYKYPDILGEVKVLKDQIVPAKSIHRLKCQTKIVNRNVEKTVLFVPLENLSYGDLEGIDTPETLHLGKKQNFHISIRNSSEKNVMIKKGTQVGNVCEITQVIPMPELHPGKRSDGENPTMAKKFELNHLTVEQKLQVKDLLEKYDDLFSKTKNDIGHIKDFKMHIDLHDKIPVSEPYRKIPKLLYDDVKNHINILLANGWITKSTSSFSSPIVCVRKRDGGLRLCCDYRKLNLKTIPEQQPIPRVQDILDNLGGQKWFSALDMSQAYYQGEIEKESRKYTAFCTPWSLYEWVVIPYGLRNAPQNFQRYMNDSLSDLRDKVCIPYLDDILVFGETFSQHLENLETVFQVLRGKGMKLNGKKCEFFKTEIKYLGRLISGEGYRPDPENADALDRCKIPPKTLGELYSLLGFLGYFRTYVKDFSRRMKPCYDLLKGDPGETSKKNKTKKITWTLELEKIIEDVVEHLKSPQVISYPDFKLPFVLHCDASQTGLGAVLYQRDEKKLKIISFASRTLTPAEKNYHLHSGKLEFLALKWAITEKFCDYLSYGPAFEVYTDNNPLTYVMTTAKLNASGLRWVAQLANFQFTLKFKSGKQNIDADYMSRLTTTAEIQATMDNSDVTLNPKDVSLVLSGINSWCPVETNVSILTLKASKENILTKISEKELAENQKLDKIIGPIYLMLQAGGAGTKKEIKTFSKITKLLARQRSKLYFKGNILMRKTKTLEQIVMPEIYKNLVYQELHTNLGHIGSDRVLDLARRRFYWPNMQKDIEFFVRNQCRCLVSKKPNLPVRAPLVPINASAPFEMISIDFLHLDHANKGGS